MTFYRLLAVFLCLLSCAFQCLHAQVVPTVIESGEGRSSSVAVAKDYVLRANDVVAMTVFQEPELACSERIAADGTIAVPLVGRVKISGLSPVGASNKIRDALEADYLVNPQVSLAVTETTKDYFTLLGQVTAPGSYAIPATGNLNILQAVGMAGGFTRLASTGKIVVKRVSGGQETLIKVDAEELAKSKGAKVFYIQPGDVISVKERMF